MLNAKMDHNAGSEQLAPLISTIFPYDTWLGHLTLENGTLLTPRENALANSGTIADNMQ